MQELFRLVQKSRVCSDCTCAYDLILQKNECTLREFIEYIKNYRSNEWGGIGINTKDNTRIASLSYSHGKCDTAMISDIMDKKIKSRGYASGGWTRMDYIITCE